MSGEPGDAPAGWPVLDSTVEYECPWFAVGVDRVRRPDGEVAAYYWIDAPDAVGVVPVTDDGDLVLVEEYRPNQGGPVVSLPAGDRDDGESYAAAGARELREETGFEAADCELLDTFVPTTRIRQAFGVVAATGLRPGEQDLDEGEFIDVRVRSPDAALSTLREGPTLAWALAALAIAREEGLV